MRALIILSIGMILAMQAAWGFEILEVAKPDDGSATTKLWKQGHWVREDAKKNFVVIISIKVGAQDPQFFLLCTSQDAKQCICLEPMTSTDPSGEKVLIGINKLSQSERLELCENQFQAEIINSLKHHNAKVLSSEQTKSIAELYKADRNPELLAAWKKLEADLSDQKARTDFVEAAIKASWPMFRERIKPELKKILSEAQFKALFKD